MTRRAEDLRVAIVAENASFKFGGEASIPIHYFYRLRARGIHTHLVVHDRTQSELASLFPTESDYIWYVRDRWFHRLLWRVSRYLPDSLYQATCGAFMVLVNQFIQRKILRDLILRDRINVIHQPIPVSPKIPSLIYGLGVPVVIGPMNGGMNYPPAFRAADSLSTRVFISIGRGCANIMNSLIPGKKRADVLLVANDRTRHALPENVTGSIVDLSENGVDLELWKPSYFDDVVPYRFIFLGRLVTLKRLDFAIRALATLPGILLQVIGDGEMKEEWAELARNLGVADRVHFLGWLPQVECAAKLRGATALLLPSIHECGGAVVLEAMAAGIPVVAVAWGGPVDYLDESCGILVHPTGEDAIISGFRAAMSKLVSDRTLAKRLGAAGRRRVEERYNWERKVDGVVEIYLQITRQNNQGA
jgi:glycosyltransferase involved in cell wall biosynthesis